MRDVIRGDKRAEFIQNTNRCLFVIKPRIVSTCCDVLKCPRRGSVCSSRWTLRNGAKHDETIGEFNIKTNEIIIHIGDTI